MTNTQQEDGGIGVNEMEALQIQTANEAEDEEGQGENDSIVSPICKPYDPEEVRKGIVYMVIVDELPFKFVEGEGFIGFMSELCPGFQVPSRLSVARDCYQLYVDERTKLKSFMNTNCERVCITTETWTSLQEQDYMCITAHFIDNDWNLQKKILNVVPVSRHDGQTLVEALETCLLYWGLKNVFTITVDNASSNETVVAFMTKKMLDWGTGIASCKYLHMRCIAHAINLVVSDVLKDIKPSVERVGDAVRYIASSLDRFKKLKECAELEGVESKSSLCLDVPTRWNSTYLMLTTAEKYEMAFKKFDELDSSFRADLGHAGVPTLRDWTCVRKYAGLLKVFYDFSLRISSCVTSSSFFSEVSLLPYILDEWKESGNCEKSLAESIKEKFDQYWGSAEKMNKIIFWASVFDPREKLDYMEFYLSDFYGTEKGDKIFQCVKNELFELFNEYMNKYHSDASSSRVADCEMVDKSPGWVLRDRFKKHKIETGIARKIKNELEVYLSEDVVEEDVENLDVLKWWRASSKRFPVLSRMARDILAVPISSIASEFAFNTHGRVLDKFKSDLPPEVVQSLICARDWIQSSERPVCVEESLDELMEFEQELTNMEMERALSDNNI